MHTVAILAVDGVIAFDLATPIEVLGRTVDDDGKPAYDLRIAGPRPTASAGPTSLTVPHDLSALLDADTVIIPGRMNYDTALPPAVIDAVRAAAKRGTRVASICIGAFDLASTGLLDGLRATTHWRHTQRLADRYPQITVDPAPLFIDNGQVLTSAGASAGLDLCLHLVGRDLGGLAAADAARTAVMPLTREAGQAQYIRRDELGAIGLTATLRWIEQHAHEQIGVTEIARAAAVSARTLNRRFATELGTTPSAWLIRTRIRHAQRLLESSDLTVDAVAQHTGIGSTGSLRAHFAAIVGTTPSRYRAALTLRG